ncbi:unnamed protein product [Closterium sp. NIES-64]|nr:unnamed protein product [Closterium sp. NIES-64]
MQADLSPAAAAHDGEQAGGRGFSSWWLHDPTFVDVRPTPPPRRRRGAVLPGWWVALPHGQGDDDDDPQGAADGVSAQFGGATAGYELAHGLPEWWIHDGDEDAAANSSGRDDGDAVESGVCEESGRLDEGSGEFVEWEARAGGGARAVDDLERLADGRGAMVVEEAEQENGSNAVVACGEARDAVAFPSWHDKGSVGGGGGEARHAGGWAQQVQQQDVVMARGDREVPCARLPDMHARTLDSAQEQWGGGTSRGWRGVEHGVGAGMEMRQEPETGREQALDIALDAARDRQGEGGGHWWKRQRQQGQASGVEDELAQGNQRWQQQQQQQQQQQEEDAEREQRQQQARRLSEQRGRLRNCVLDEPQAERQGGGEGGTMHNGGGNNVLLPSWWVSMPPHQDDSTHPPQPHSAPIHYPSAMATSSHLLASAPLPRLGTSLLSASRSIATTAPRRIAPRAPVVAAADSSSSAQHVAAAAPQADRRSLLLAGLALACGATTAAGEARAASCELTATPSGLQFCDTAVGDGVEAAAGMLIKAHYNGTLLDGTVFDNSYRRGRPLVFRVGAGEVIKGWDLGIVGGEGIPPMRAGGKRTLRIPASLAYGARGAGCRGGSCIIPPNSDLLFDVEFVGKA